MNRELGQEVVADADHPTGGQRHVELQQLVVVRLQVAELGRFVDAGGEGGEVVVAREEHEQVLPPVRQGRLG